MTDTDDLAAFLNEQANWRLHDPDDFAGEDAAKFRAAAQRIKELEQERERQKPTQCTR